MVTVSDSLSLSDSKLAISLGKKLLCLKSSQNDFLTDIWLTLSDRARNAVYGVIYKRMKFHEPEINRSLVATSSVTPCFVSKFLARLGEKKD